MEGNYKFWGKKKESPVIRIEGNFYMKLQCFRYSLLLRSHRVLSHSRYRPPTPVLVKSKKWKVKVKSEKWKLKVSSKLSNLRTPIVHADLIFLYLRIAVKKNCYGFTWGDLSTRVPGYSRNLGNYEGRFAHEGRLACEGRLALPRWREASSLASLS